jgi:photosystem II stability/assembly factor-like uncharacterized protein
VSRIVSFLCLSLLFWATSCQTGKIEPNKPEIPTKTPFTPEKSAPREATEIVIDGQATDWAGYGIRLIDEQGDVPEGTWDVGEIRTFNNNARFYLLIMPHRPGSLERMVIPLSLGYSPDITHSIELNFQTQQYHVLRRSDQQIILEGVEVAKGEGIELSIPLIIFKDETVHTLNIEVYSGNTRIEITDDIYAERLLELEQRAAPETGAIAALLDTGKNDNTEPEVYKLPKLDYSTYDSLQLESTLQNHQGESLLDQSWIRMGGPLGGIGYDIRISPNSPQLMFVTDSFAGVHKSEDGGLTWFPSNEGILARTGPSADAIPVFCLTIDPNDDQVIWIGLQNMRGVYRSIDGGNTWEQRDQGIAGDNGITVRGISVEPGNSDVVYVAGEISSSVWAGEPRQGIGFDMTKGFVYKTINSGETWQMLWEGDNLARYVLIDPTDVKTIYVSTGIMDREAANSNPVGKTAGGVGIIKTTDGGKTWTQVNNGLENLYIGSLAMHPTNPKILLAGAGNWTYREGSGAYLSENGGESWQKVIGQQTTVDVMMSVEFYLPEPDIAYAATSGGPFYISYDRGKSWQDYTLAHENYWAPIGYRVASPIDLQADLYDPLKVYANNYGGGNYLTEDGGKTWRSVSSGYTGSDILSLTIHPENPAIIAAGAGSGIHLSADGGNTWRGICPINVMDAVLQEGVAIAFDPLNPARILASDAQWGWLFESQDWGSTWKMAVNYNQQLQGQPTIFQTGIFEVEFAPSNPNTLFIGMSNSKCINKREAGTCTNAPVANLLKSIDNGKKWVEIRGTPFENFSVSGIAIHPQDEQIIWVATAGDGIFMSVDGGITWEEKSAGLETPFLMALSIDPNNPDMLIVGTANRAIYTSIDGGETWTVSAYGMDPNERISAVVVDPVRPGVVYAGSKNSGVFVSQDYGATWSLHNEGLRTRAIISLEISSDGTTLYAGTQGEGIFRLSTLSQEEFNEIAPIISGD